MTLGEEEEEEEGVRRSEGASEEREGARDKRIGISVKEKYHCKSPY